MHLFGGDKIPTLAVQLAAWCSGVLHRITWPWAWDHELWPPYDVHLWTIPIEFNHSMLLFIAILCLSRLRLLVRRGLNLALLVYFMLCGKWAAFEFFAGMFLAE